MQRWTELWFDAVFNGSQSLLDAQPSQPLQAGAATLLPSHTVCPWLMRQQLYIPTSCFRPPFGKIVLCRSWMRRPGGACPSSCIFPFPAQLHGARWWTDC